MIRQRLARQPEFWADKDGRYRAPQGTPQYPDLLRGFKRRPPWKVAGVDYRVGPNTPPIKDPAAISMTGASADTGTHIVTVTGNGVVLDGYDFSLAGGWQVFVDANSVQIRNCVFGIGANQEVPIRCTDQTPQNVYVGFCRFEGNDQNVGTGAQIQWDGVGITLEYCYFRDAGGDQIQSSTGGTVTFRYCLFDETGQGGVGIHGDILQCTSDFVFIGKFLFNTTRQSSGFTQGFCLEPGEAPDGNVASGAFLNNTFICQIVDTQYFYTAVTTSALSGQATWRDNYYWDGAGAGLAPGSGRGGPDDGNVQTIFEDNVEMASGSNSANDT